MLDKAFDPATLEARLYAASEASGAFHADPSRAAAPYTIVIPPPNVTGSLHIGHALNNTLQDVLVRFRRMQGRDALWMPGTDHAGIATQMVVERLLATEGKKRQEMGREAFLERVWQWKGESGGTITRQLRRLGASLDWERERFTMDEGLSAAVLEVFVRLHKEGLIYRDTRLVNWDPVFQSAISDLEVESREVKGNLWTLRYPVEGQPGRFIRVATTRPETMLGDTAVAVHPEDARFADLVGKHAILPLTGRRIPIVADSYSDPEKGTGAVKITPAHDFNDYEVGRRHDLPMPSVLDAEARVMLSEIEAELAAVEGVADPGFVRSLAGMDRFAARKAILAELERLELLEATEPHTHQVPHGDRSGVPIEPRLTLQWYCDAATLAKPAIAAVEDGRTQFVPRQYENLFFAWMRDIQPWCVSRQLWWGHRIPAWYGPDGQVFVERSEAEALAAAAANYGRAVELTRDPDVLDTWFSSALWPFSTLGWPEQTAELKKHYPTDVLVTGFDIIFFWVARMMMMGLHFMDGEVPFKHVVIHGLVRDARGQKMSKSKGNVLDPLELIDQHGADAVRFTLCALASPGRDVKLDPQRLEGYRAFATKLWNAARFLEMNGVRVDASWRPEQAEGVLARWLLAKADDAARDATAALDAFRFDDYASTLYGFTWNTYCDWFIEFAKPVLNGPDGPEKDEVRGVAQYVLGQVLRLLHPVMPFITAELFEKLGYGEAVALTTAAYPKAEGQGAASAAVDLAIAAITAIRSARSALNVPAAAVLPLRVGQGSAASLQALRDFAPQIMRLARVEAPQFLADAAEGAGPGASAVAVDVPLFLPLSGVVDLAAEAKRLAKDRAKAEAERAKLEAKLANPGFRAKAEEAVIAETEQRLADAAAEVARLDAALTRISS
ncbi:valine--tRNA ligase [Roseococcus thiosulfatophilus]|uniref:valine--tRNA ligase n=1 Tax=Roseococcus thiosulfatophilus TaxID=35813 RepID=UPI001A8E83C1|nr:valine--tRNA ligase [Roseococcus thiosulfatophilus]